MKEIHQDFVSFVPLQVVCHFGGLSASATIFLFSLPAGEYFIKKKFHIFLPSRVELIEITLLKCDSDSLPLNGENGPSL